MGNTRRTHSSGNVFADLGFAPAEADAMQREAMGLIHAEQSQRLAMKNGMRPIHPGEVLREDFLIPLGLSAATLATALHVPASRIRGIVRERCSVSADTALRLARYFGGDAQSWLNLQAAFALRTAKIAAGKAIAREVLPRAA